MQTIAYEFRCAVEAGLVLTGEDNDGAPEFTGKPEQWQRFGQLVKWFEDIGYLPFIKRGV